MPREIFVTNNNDFTHTDLYDGAEFVFPPGERVAIPVDAAVHLFGFNNPDKSDALSRLGWSGKLKVLPDGRAQWEEDLDGVRRLANFVFTKAVLAEAPADATHEAPSV